MAAEKDDDADDSRKAGRAYIVAISGQLSMVWNETYVESLTQEQVFRWCEDGDIRQWTDKQCAEFVRLLTISHLGPPPVDLAALLGDFYDFLKGVRKTLAVAREVLVHDVALDFCEARARDNAWALPKTLRDRSHKAVRKLLGKA